MARETNSPNLGLLILSHFASLCCRPGSEDEIKQNIPQVITCNEGRKEVSLYQNNLSSSKVTDRTFTFDKVCQASFPCNLLCKYTKYLLHFLVLVSPYSKGKSEVHDHAVSCVPLCSQTHQSAISEWMKGRLSRSTLCLIHSEQFSINSCTAAMTVFVNKSD